MPCGILWSCFNGSGIIPIYDFLRKERTCNLKPYLWKRQIITLLFNRMKKGKKLKAAFLDVGHYIRNGKLVMQLLIVLIKTKKLTVKKISNFVKTKLIYSLRLNATPAAPSVLMMELSTHCNLACPRCRDEEGKMSNRVNLFNKYGHSTEDDKFWNISLGNMKYEVFKKVVDDVKEYVIFLILYSSGEPFMNKHVADMIGYASDNGIATIISTNGHFFSQKKCEEILKTEPTLIIISVSGFEQETYAKYHRKGNIEEVKAGISRLCRTKERLNVSTIINIRYLIFSHNEHFFKEDRKRFLMLGADSVTARPGQFFDVDQVDAFAPTQFVPYRKAISGNAATQTTNSPCPFLWNVAVVHWDGKILPCCELSYNPELINLGDINKEGFQQVWEGGQYNAFRIKHLKGERSTIKACKGCHVKGSFFQA